MCKKDVRDLACVDCLTFFTGEVFDDGSTSPCPRCGCIEACWCDDCLSGKTLLNPADIFDIVDLREVAW